MPSKYRLRYIFKPIIDKIAKIMSKIGITANLATILMQFHAFLAFIFLAFLENLLLFAIFVFLTGIFDGVDGAIARLNNKATSFGGFFDSLMDRISEFIIFLALLLNFWNQLLWNLIDMKLIILISFFSSLMISYSRARAEMLQKGDFDIGLMARSERLFYLFITMLLAFFIGMEQYFIFIFMILVSITAFFRCIKIKNLIEK